MLLDLIYFWGFITLCFATTDLPFLNVTSYSVLRNCDDCSVPVHVPSPVLFDFSSYTTLYVSSNGLISFGSSFSSFSPNMFPLPDPYAPPIVAPYWDDIHPSGDREIRYAIVTPSNDSSIINQINSYLTSSTGNSVNVDWILWAYWYDVCPYGDRNCLSHESNYFQVVLAVQSNVTYSIFIYECDLIQWTRHNAAIGFSANSQFYTNHPLSRTINVTDIDCYDDTNLESEWTNIVYKLNGIPPLMIHPWYGNILGGVPIQVSGPNFKENDVITLSFDDSTLVNCSYIDNFNALCVTPFLSKAGMVNVELYQNSIPYERTTTYYSVSIENDAKVNVQGTNRLFKSGETIDITWSPSSLSDNATSKVDVFMYEIQEMADGTFINKEIGMLATDLPNNGHATVTVPVIQSSDSSVAQATSLITRSINILVELKNKASNAIDVVTNKIGQWTDSLWVSITDAYDYAVDNALYASCLAWAASEPASIGPTLLNEVTSDAPCPPNARQARTENSGLVEDTKGAPAFFHPGASSCFRQREASRSGAGNQCCYRANGTLIVGPPGGGTVDKIAPTGTGLDYLANVVGHFAVDVIPFLLCCKGGKSDCSKYYDRRPSDDGSSFNPPVPACVYGDPHIVTLDLHKYTFNGKGEFTLIETDDNWLTVQGRMIEASDINGNNAPGTVFSAVAAKQANSDIVQLEIIQDELVCLINGEETDFSVLKTQDFNNVTVTVSGNNTFSASFRSGAFLKIQEMNGFIAVLIVSLPTQYKNETRGLMGNYNGNINDDLIPKGGNGIPIPLNSSLQVIHQQFGISWIVDDPIDSLFSYQFPESWSTYYRPYFTPVFEAVFIDPNLEQTANEICGDDEFCKFDIAATGRVEIGEATFTGGRNFEQLINLSQPITCNPPCVHGACVSTDVCVCGEGYSGSTCDTIVTSPCSNNNPCNGGSCLYHAGNYICTCLPGLTGPFCDNTYTPCDSNPCRAGSTCQYHNGTISDFSCICPQGYTGTLCEVTATTESNAGLIAGVTVGVLLALIIVAVITSSVVLVIYLRIRQSKSPKSPADHDYQMDHYPVKA